MTTNNNKQTVTIEIMPIRKLFFSCYRYIIRTYWDSTCYFVGVVFFTFLDTIAESSAIPFKYTIISQTHVLRFQLISQIHVLGFQL